MANVRLSLTVFGQWCKEQIGNQFRVAWARQPDEPDRVATILRVGAGRDRHDYAFEEVPFRIQCRGAEEKLADAEFIAYTMDDLVFGIKNTMIGPVYVTDAWAVNKPKQVPITDKQARYQFTADYLLLASRFNEEA